MKNFSKSSYLPQSSSSMISVNPKNVKIIFGDGIFKKEEQKQQKSSITNDNNNNKQKQHSVESELVNAILSSIFVKNNKCNRKEEHAEQQTENKRAFYIPLPTGNRSSRNYNPYDYINKELLERKQNKDENKKQFTAPPELYKKLKPVKPLTRKWKARFFQLAHEVSTWSKDNSTKVGCVIVNQDGKVLGMGYNGIIASIDDNILKTCKHDKEEQRKLKNNYTLHAEINALLNCRNISENDKLYIFSTRPICKECAKYIAANKNVKMVISNINEIVCNTKEFERFTINWDTKTAEDIFTLSGIDYFYTNYDANARMFKMQK